MTDKSIDQIAEILAENEVCEARNELYDEHYVTAQKVHDISIKSPEAAEYWFEKVTDEYRNYKGFRHFDDDLSQENRDSIIEALKEAQSDE